LRKLALLLSVLTFASGVCSQESAPKLDVCRADYATWHDTKELKDYYIQETQHIRDGTPNTNRIVQQSAQQVGKQLLEVSLCMSVDASNKDNYYEMHRFFSDVLSDRYRGFLARHNLWEQFIQEDIAGER
jgi:hypothetical protein